MPANDCLDKRVAAILAAVEQREEQERIIAFEEPKIQVVVFLLAHNYYAFYGEAIKEILTVAEITYVPGMPEYLLGVMNVRGEIESVLDLRSVFGLPAAPLTPHSRIMLGQAQALRSGLLVDSVADVLEIPADRIHQPEGVLEADRTAYLAGESTYREHALMILDLAKIFEKLLNY